MIKQNNYILRKILYSYLNVIKKSLVKYSIQLIYKALPIGHISHRSGGDYKKIAPRQWVKVEEKKDKKKLKEKKFIKPINNLDDLIKDKINDEEIKKKTVSPKFKEWFGDWENDKKNSSKVRNPDGSPKMVYHGSGYEINDFSFGAQRGFGLGYFTESLGTAQKYAIGGGISEKYTREEYLEKLKELQEKGKYKKRNPTVVPVFLNIRKPLTEDTVNIKSVFGDNKEDFINAVETNDEYYREYLEEVIDDEDEFDTGANEILETIGKTNPYVGEEQEALSKSPKINALLSLALTDPELGNNLKKYYDGMIYDDNETGNETYVIFNANQVKSATQSSNFDSNEANINKEVLSTESSPALIPERLRKKKNKE
ncbi:MAG: hypothetical protein ACM31H_01925 [Nitrososphaerales archaeon]